MPACDDTAAGGKSACTCHQQCARILSQACSPYGYYPDWYSTHCVAACDAANDAQRQTLAACTPAYPCDPTCFKDIGWDPSVGNPGDGADASTDGSMGLGDAGF
jgi:hypothetical protein